MVSEPRPLIRCAACGRLAAVVMDLASDVPDIADPRHGYLRLVKLACGHRRLVEPAVLRNAPREGARDDG